MRLFGSHADRVQKTATNTHSVLVSPAMEPLEAGVRIGGRYEIVRLLGKGAAKYVYLAHDVIARTQVAVAVLRQRPESDPTLGPRFSREARAASVLSSPYVVRVLDVGKLENGERYLVSEAVIGRGLDDAVTYGAVDPMSAAYWTAEVLDALSEAHGKGVLHRDVKPENVLLEPDESHPVGERARLTDFGLAKVLDTALEGSVMLHTAQGVVMGTADYMSPEQWQGGHVDRRSDLYSVGAMFFELLTGRVPYVRGSLQEICMAHVAAEVPTFDDRVMEGARVFEGIARRALSKRPSMRFQSADEMRTAIEAVGKFTLARNTMLDVNVDDIPFTRAEVVSDALVGAVQIVATSRVVLGRAGHMVLRCVPITEENDRRSRTLSRRHAILEWHGGTATLRDLGSSSGTTVANVSVDAAGAGVPLRQGDIITLGPHVRLRFDH
jgi:eukaryotic-like serine/threonine-protein kinase